ncbi:MAG: hypothetical protein AAF772_03100 [Acidobacteriota bacterium]
MGKRIEAILQTLHRGDLDLADERLLEAEAVLENAAGDWPPAVLAVFQMEYWSVRAYREYRHGRVEQTTESIAQAVQCVEIALSLHAFLVPITGRCYEYQLHLARLARADADWPAMWRHLETGRDMMAGRRPLCHPLHGPVYVDDICAFYRSIEPLNELEAETVRRLGEPTSIQREYNALCLSVTIAPFVVLDWREGRLTPTPVPTAPTPSVCAPQNDSPTDLAARSAAVSA